MLAVTDIRTGEEYKQALENIGCEVVALPRFPLLAEPVSAHPDMLFFIINGKLITHKLYYDIAKQEIDKILIKGNLMLVLSEEKTGEKYPFDVLFNAALVGNKIIGNKNYISKHIISEAEKSGIELVHTNQGYAKCSVCCVGDNAVITADNSVYEAAKQSGIDVLKISEGFVELNGYNYGFIGGATGNDKGNVYFYGDLEKHPDVKKIKVFLNKHNKKAVSLSKEKLYDFGTLVLINN